MPSGGGGVEQAPPKRPPPKRNSVSDLKEIWAKQRPIVYGKKPDLQHVAPAVREPSPPPPPKPHSPPPPPPPKVPSVHSSSTSRDGMPPLKAGSATSNSAISSKHTPTSMDKRKADSIGSSASKSGGKVSATSAASKSGTRSGGGSRSPSYKSEEKKLDMDQEERALASEAPKDDNRTESKIRERFEQYKASNGTQPSTPREHLTSRDSARFSTATESSDIDSAKAVTHKRPKNYTPPPPSRSREPTGSSNNREPGGHRLHENYNRPPPNFTIAIPPRERSRSRSRSRSRRGRSNSTEEQPPHIEPVPPPQQRAGLHIEPSQSNTETSNTHVSSEPGGKRLRDPYNRKKLVMASGKPPRMKDQSHVHQQQQTQRVPAIPTRAPPPMRIHQDQRWRSARDCDGIAPREDMYPSRRVAVDSPGGKIGEMSAEERLAKIKQKLAMAEHMAALRNMKQHSVELQDFLNSISEQYQHQRQQGQYPSHVNKHKELVGQLEKDMVKKQGTHDKLVELVSSVQSEGEFTPNEELLKALEADMQRDQQEYDALMGKVSQIPGFETIQATMPKRKADPPPSHVPADSYVFQPVPMQVTVQQQVRSQLDQLYHKTKKQHLPHSPDRPFDEIPDDEIPLDSVYLVPPDPPTKSDQSISEASTHGQATPAQEGEPEKEEAKRKPSSKGPKKATMVPPVASVEFAPTTKASSSKSDKKKKSSKPISDSQNSSSKNADESETAQKTRPDTKQLRFSASTRVISAEEKRPQGRRISLRRDSAAIARFNRDVSLGVHSEYSHGDRSQDKGSLVALVINQGWERVDAKPRKELDRWSRIMSSTGGFEGSSK